MGTENTVIKDKASIEALFNFDKFLGNAPEDKKEGENKSEKIFEKQETEQLKEEEKDKTPEQVASEVSDSFSALSPTMVIEMFDIVMSRTFAMPMKLLGYECKVEEFKLTASEKKFLSPFIASVVVDYLKTLKPRDVLIIALIFMYGGKTFDVVTSRERKGKKKKVQAPTKTINDIDNLNDLIIEDSDAFETIKYNKDGSIAKKRGPKSF